jgi:AraC-like ligand binding domain
VVVGLATAGEHTSRYGLRRYDIGLGDVLLVNAGEVHAEEASCRIAGREPRRST